MNEFVSYLTIARCIPGCLPGFFKAPAFRVKKLEDRRSIERREIPDTTDCTREEITAKNTVAATEDISRSRESFMKIRNLWKLFKKSFEEWYEDDPFQKAAALAYYTLFSLAPLLIILIGIVGLFSGTTEAQEYIVGGLAGLLGDESAGAIREMVRNANREGSGGFATVTGIVLLLFGAGGVLGQFQYSLNQIWGVKTKADSGWWPIIRARFFSYAMLLVIGFLLLVPCGHHGSFRHDALFERTAACRRRAMAGLGYPRVIYVCDRALCDDI